MTFPHNCGYNIAIEKNKLSRITGYASDEFITIPGPDGNISDVAVGPALCGQNRASLLIETAQDFIRRLPYVHRRHSLRKPPDLLEEERPSNLNGSGKEVQKMRFIGFYDYTVILTYISLISSVLGMTRAIHGDYKSAIICLAVSGICDAFDGRIARSKKNRTDDEKSFGIQLDSLCDVICFGLFPAMICYLLGVRGVLGVALVMFYCLCAVIRLAFFNVLEGKRQSAEGGAVKIYRGLPVTSIAFILPLAFWLQFVLPELVFMILLHVILLSVGFLFILDFPLKKPGLKTIVSLSLILIVTVGVIFAYTRFRVPAPTDQSNPLVEEIIEEIEDISDDEAP